MSNLEYYFENLLYEGLDYEDETNKSQLTAEQIDAVKTCAAYITYTFFCVKDELKKYINGEIDVIKTGKWKRIDYANEVNGYVIPNYECSNCQNWVTDMTDYCPNCGALMRGEEDADKITK